MNTNGIETKKFNLPFDMIYIFYRVLLFFLAFLLFQFIFTIFKEKHVEFSKCRTQKIGIMYGESLFILLTLKSRPIRNQIKTKSFFKNKIKPFLKCYRNKNKYKLQIENHF